LEHGRVYNPGEGVALHQLGASTNPTRCFID